MSELSGGLIVELPDGRGDAFLNPMLPAEAATLLSAAGAQQIARHEARAGTALLVARAGT